MDASTSIGVFPPAIILPYAGSAEPGFGLFANGQAVSRTTYAKLFGIIGTTYGAGDGSTTFNVPNFNGRAPIGVGTYTDSVSGSVTRTLGQSLGAEKHALASGELPPHTHNVPIDTGAGPTNNVSQTVVGPGNSAGSVVTSSVGSGTAHNNMQPSLAVNFIITI